MSILKKLATLLAAILFLSGLSASSQSNYPIKRIVLHVSDTDDKYDIGKHEIDIFHKYFKGWNGCGYHYVIRKNGEVETCRSEETIGAHVKDHNKNSIGIVWVGRNDLNFSQKRAMIKLVKELLVKHNLNKRAVVGHVSFDTAIEQHKTCPNIDMDDFRREL